MCSPSETVQAAVRELRPGLHAAKRIFVGKIGYAIFGEQDGMIVPGAKDDYAESIVGLKRRFQRPNGGIRGCSYSGSHRRSLRP